MGGKQVMPEQPEISIIFITSEQRARAQRCLDRVLCQDGLVRAEVLLYDLAAGSLPPLQGSQHPAVRLIPAQPDAGFHELRFAAVRAARGKAVAFVDDHTLVCDGWLPALMDDFAQGYAGVAAVPAFERPGEGVTDILELMHYMGFENIKSRQEVDGLVGHNPAYRREALLAFGDQLPDLLSCDLLLEQRLRQRGLKFLIDPAVGFVHLNIVSAYDLYQVCYLRDRVFSATRARLSGWGTARRLAQLAAGPVMPLLRLARAVRHLRQAAPARLSVLRRYLGVFLVSQLYAGMGLGLGAVFGAGDADRRFTQYELNRLRFRALVPDK
jgi:hypothetical protein